MSIVISTEEDSFPDIELVRPNGEKITLPFVSVVETLIAYSEGTIEPDEVKKRLRLSFLDDFHFQYTLAKIMSEVLDKLKDETLKKALENYYQTIFRVFAQSQEKAGEKQKQDIQEVREEESLTV